MDQHKLAEALRSYMIGKGETGIFGNTKDGDAWARFALDPADSLNECKGMPDGTVTDVAIEKFSQTIFVRAPPTTVATDLFDYIFILRPDVITPVDVIVRPQSNYDDVSASYTYFNNQLAGYRNGNSQNTQATRIAYDTQTYTNMVEALRVNYTNLRILGESLTLEQSASSLADQGMIIATQQYFTPKKTSVTDNSIIGNNEGIEKHTYRTGDFPTQENAANNDKKYSRRVREGCYMPLLLGEKFQKFWDVESDVSIISPTVGGGVNVLGSNPAVAVLPVPLVRPTVTNGTPGLGIQGNRMGIMHVAGIPPGTTFQIKFIMMIEAQSQAGSPASTRVFHSPDSDPRALAIYGELRDKVCNAAYPEDWNFGGRLGAWLMKHVVPVVKSGFRGAMNAGLGNAMMGGLGSMYDAYQNRGKKVRREPDEEEGLQASDLGSAEEAPPLPPRKGTRTERVEFVD
jgi:hypothetical protein